MCLGYNIFRQAVQHFGRKGYHLQFAGLSLRDAAAAQVKEFVRVQPAKGGAVAALDVIGINLQLRQALRTASVTQKQVMVLLIGLGADAMIRHLDEPEEFRTRLPGEDSLEQLATGAARHSVLHIDLEIDP